MRSAHRWYEGRERSVIIVQFDQHYHDWAYLMLRSLALHDTRSPVFADTINLSHEQVSELRHAYPHITIDNDTIPECEISKSFMANRKAFVLQKAMDRFPDQPRYGLFDADMLIRRPLDDLWVHVDTHLSALFVTNGMWEGRFYLRLVTPSGIVLVRPDGRRLIDTWVKWFFHDEPIEAIQPREWYWDQVTLAMARRESRLPIRSIPMQVFADCGLSPRAAIWSAHVTQKEEYYARFQHEYERQRQVRKAARAASGRGPRPRHASVP